MRLTNLQVHVFGPFEIFHDTKTVSLLVAPDTLKARAIFQRAKRVLPVPVRIESETLEHVSAREAEKVLVLESVNRELFSGCYLRGSCQREPQQYRLSIHSCDSCTLGEIG